LIVVIQSTQRLRDVLRASILAATLEEFTAALSEEQASECRAEL